MKKQQPWFFIGLPSIYHLSKGVIFLDGSESYDENNACSLFKPDLSFLPTVAQLVQGIRVVGSFEDLILCDRVNHDQSVCYICIPSPCSL